MKRAVFVCLAALLTLVTVSAFAQSVVTEPVGFQGRLAKPDGTPVADGSYKLTFSIYSAATGGTFLWQQVSPAVPVRNGAFAARLDFTTGYQGANTRDTTFLLAAPYLEIKVGTDPALTPRQKFTNVVYSYYANTASTVPDGSLTAGKFAAGALNFGAISGAISNSQIAAGTITSDKLAASVLNGGVSAYLMNTNAVPTGSDAFEVALSGGYLYAVNNLSNTLQIFDVSAPAQPASVGVVATGSNPIDVAVSGNYAFVVNYASNTLQIFDVTTKTAPVLVGSVVTSAVPTGVAVSGNYAYVVTAGGNNLQIFNVTIKSAPALASAIGAGGSPSDVLINGNYAYVTNATGNLLQVFNITNPNGPTLAGSAATGSNPQRMALSGTNLYVTNYNSASFSIYNVAAPAAPVLLNTVTTDNAPFAIAVSGATAFVTSRSGNLLAAYDVSAPAAPVSLGSISTGDDGDSLAVSGAYIFCGVYAQNLLRVYQVTTPGVAFPNLAVSGVLNVQSGLSSPSGAVSVFGSLSVDPYGKNGASLATGIYVGSAAQGIASNHLTAVNQFGLDFYTNATNRLAITNAGRVGIGNTNPGYALDVTGDINARGVVRANGTALTSDARYKTNVATLNKALENVLDLRGVSYDWDRAKWPAKNFSDTRQIGFIAQEIEKIFPELVLTDKEGYKSVNYVGVVPVAIEAIKALNARVDAQKREIDELKARVKRQEDIEARLKTLEDALNIHTVTFDLKSDAKK